MSIQVRNSKPGTLLQRKARPLSPLMLAVSLLAEKYPAKAYRNWKRARELQQGTGYPPNEGDAIAVLGGKPTKYNTLVIYQLNCKTNARILQINQAQAASSDVTVTCSTYKAWVILQLSLTTCAWINKACLVWQFNLTPNVCIDEIMKSSGLIGECEKS